MKFQKRYAALFIVFAIVIVSALPVFAEEAVTIRHNFPEKMKVGEFIREDMTDPFYKIYFENLDASKPYVWLTSGVDYTSQNGEPDCFGYHGGGSGPESIDSKGTAIDNSLHYFTGIYKPGVWVFQPAYCYDEGKPPEKSDYTKVGDSFTVTVEEPVIQTNAPLSVQAGDTLKFTTELTNTALVNKDTAYYLNNNNYSGDMLIQDETHKFHEPAYQPSVEILEGKELVSQSNQDYSNTLKSSEMLTFTGTGTVKLKVTYNQFITCAFCQEIRDENYQPTGKYDTYNPEKVITIQVTDKSTSITDSNSGVVISGNNLPNDVTLAVKSNDKQAIQNAEAALADVSYNDFIAFDITLADHNGNTVQPSGKVQVSIPLSEKFKVSDNLGIYYVDSNAKAIKLNSWIESDRIIFEADHFSTYVLVAEKVGNTPEQPQEQDPTINNPQTGDNSFLLTATLFLLISSTTLVFLFIRKKKRS